MVSKAAYGEIFNEFEMVSWKSKSFCEHFRIRDCKKVQGVHSKLSSCKKTALVEIK